MEEKERYISKKIIKDVVMPDGLYEIKDRESDFYLIIENKKDVDTIINLLNQQDKENQQLKQQLHDLPKKIVGEIKDKIPEIGGMKCEIIIDDFLTLNALLDKILKKYGGENE